MPGPDCTICRSPQLAAVHAALDQGTGVNATARAHKVSVSALKRHIESRHYTRKAVMVPPTRDPESAPAEGGFMGVPTTAAEWVEKLARELDTLIAYAKQEGVGTIGDRVKTLQAAIPMVEKLGRLTGELGPDRERKILDAPEWAAVLACVLAALKPWPEARATVLEALRTYSAPEARTPNDGPAE